MSRIAIIGENSIEYINILFDIWNNGDSAVLIDWRIPIRKAIEMMMESSVEKCYIDSELLVKGASLPPCSISFVPYSKINISAAVLPPHLYEKFVENYSTEEAVVIFSSGTTGKSKGVMLSHFAIQTNADFIYDYMRLSSSDCLYITKALTHSSTLIGELLVGMKNNVRIVLSSTIVTPRFTLNNIIDHGATVLCANPNLLYLYEKASKLMKRRTTLHSLYTSGAIVDIEQIRNAQLAFPTTFVLNAYGLSEAGPRVSAQTRGDCLLGLGSVGKPIGSVKIEIRRNDGSEAGVMERGIIFINTVCLFLGYISGNNDVTDNGWLNTGDIGYCDEYNNLYVIGRSDNMITVGSHNVYPEQIEIDLLKIDGLLDCVIIKFDNNVLGKQMVCYYVSERVLENELRQYCLGRYALYEVPHDFIRIEELPKTYSGKKIREASMYLSFGRQLL